MIRSLWYSLLFSIISFSTFFVSFDSTASFSPIGPIIDLLNTSRINWSASTNIDMNTASEKLGNFTIQAAYENLTFSRISTEIHIGTFEKIPYLLISYATNSSIGDPKFIVEIRKLSNDTNNINLGNESTVKKTEKYLWSADLGNTLGYYTTRVLPLPADISNSDIQIRFYVITNDDTNAYVKFQNFSIIKI